MNLRLRVVAPPGAKIDPELVPRLRQVLINIEVAFTVDEDSSPCTPIVEVLDTTDAEAEFIVRILQRAGYDIQIETP